MRRFLILAVVLILAVTANAGVFPFKYQVNTLDNGLKVIMIPMRSEGLVAYYSVVRTGSRDEWEPGHTGFAHFFEHMMFRGTDKYPSALYEKKISEMGAQANAFTSDDLTCYFLNLASEDLPLAIDLESDRFQNLRYPEQEFQTEAGAVYGEYRKGRTSPFSVLGEALKDKAFDVHTYKHTTMGFEKDVAAMPTMYDYSKSFFARYYRPENVVVIIAGDFDPAKTMDLIKKNYGSWKKGYVPPKIKPEPEQKGERSLEVSYDGRSLPILTIAWKGEAFDPKNRQMVAGMLAGDLLFGETSDVYRQLVLEQRLVQRLMSDFATNRDVGLWSVTAMIGQEKDIDATKQAIDEAIANFVKQPPDAGRLEDLKRRERYSFLMGLATPANVAGSLVRFVAQTGGVEAVDAYYETLQQVTPQDVQQAATHYLVKKHRTIAVLKGVQK